MLPALAPDAADDDSCREGEHVKEHAQCSACLEEIDEDDDLEICETCNNCFHWPSTAACQRSQHEQIRSLKWDHEEHMEECTGLGVMCPTCHHAANGADGSHNGGGGAAVGHDRCFKDSDDALSEDSDEEEVGYAAYCKLCDEYGEDVVECIACHHAFHNSLSGQAGDLCRQNLMDNHANVYKWLTENEVGLKVYEAIYVRQTEKTCPTCCFDCFEWHRV